MFFKPQYVDIKTLYNGKHKGDHCQWKARRIFISTRKKTLIVNISGGKWLCAINSFRVILPNTVELYLDEPWIRVFMN